MFISDIYIRLCIQHAILNLVINRRQAILITFITANQIRGAMRQPYTL